MSPRRESLSVLALHVAAAFTKSIAAKAVLRIYERAPRGAQRWIGRGAKVVDLASRLLDGKSVRWTR
jgi:hypothetical protein